MAVAQQLLLMLAESLFVGVLLLASFRLERWFGPSLIYIVFGMIFQLAALLAAAVYLQLGPTIVVSPGSVVLFPAVLFLVLLVYLSSDALEARRLIYGVAGANIALLPIQVMVAQHLGSPIVINPFHVVPELFTSQLRVVAASSFVLFPDTVLVCILYEATGRFTRSTFARILLSLTVTLYFDSFVFVTAAFGGTAGYQHILLSQLAAKTFAGIVYSLVLVIYLVWFAGPKRARAGDAIEPGSMFRLFTYRRPYEELERLVVRDALTDVYNRGFFDEAIEQFVGMSRQSGRPISMMMVDVDHFKRVNDVHGHTAGDRILQRVAGALVATLRVSDYVCRYGGDEFAVLLPQTDLAQAIALAERIRTLVPGACAEGGEPGANEITVTVGVAAFPTEVADATGLIRVADQRLYAGKTAGRNRVSAGDQAAAALRG
jgi:diguanylate cyclase (GGDEF)-like protein